MKQETLEQIKKKKKVVIPFLNTKESKRVKEKTIKILPSYTDIEMVVINVSQLRWENT